MLMADNSLPRRPRTLTLVLGRRQISPLQGPLADGGTEMFKRCPRCAGRVDSSGRCTRCAAYVGGRGWRIHVEGTDAGEVERVATALARRSGERALGESRSPWVAGSFYLTVAIVAVAVLLATARLISAVLLPIVIVGAVVLLCVIGALQLRHDAKLSEKSFLSLMSLALAQLRFFGRRPRTAYSFDNSAASSTHRDGARSEDGVSNGS